MSQYIVNFTQTLIVKGVSEDDAIATAKDLFAIQMMTNDVHIEEMAIDCEILPSIFTTKETR
jgi:hypothetical protein